MLPDISSTASAPLTQPAAIQIWIILESPMGMSCEQKINTLKNKVKSEGPDIIPISNIHFLSKMDTDIGYKKFVHYNGKYPSAKMSISYCTVNVSVCKNVIL